MNYAAILSNPFDSTPMEYIEVLESETVSEFLERTRLSRKLRMQPCVVELDGKELLEEDFGTIIGDQHLAIKPLVEELGTIIFIALVAFNATKILSNVLAPDIPDPTKRGTENSPSISSRNNRARIGEAKPFLVGKLRVYPDLAAAPYTEFNHDGSVDLFQLFEVSLGEAEIYTATARFDDTLLSSFSGVDLEVLPPNTESRIFPSEVFVSAEMSDIQIEDGFTNEFVISPTGEKATRLAFDFTSKVYRARSSGKIESWTVRLKVQIQEIDDAGVAIGGWKNLVFTEHQTAEDYGNPSEEQTQLIITGSSTDEIRQTVWVNVPDGRYKARIERITPINESYKITDSVLIKQAKAYLKNTTTNDHSTQIALRLRSSESIGNRALSKFNIEAMSKFETWSPGGGWAAAAISANPAWAMASVIRSQWGGQRSDSSIDLQGLYDLSLKYDSEGIECNGIFDSTTDVWKALQAIGASCYTDPVRFGGMIGGVFDEEAVAPSFFFNMRNIVRGSFSIENKGVVDETPDYFLIKYLDAAEDYRELTIECALSGSPKLRKKEMFLWGVTDREQAFKIGMYQAAKVRYRRKLVSFEVMQEGQIPFYGNLVRVSHYMIGAEGVEQSSGDVLSVNGSDLTLSTRPEGYTSPYVIITNQMGEPLGPYVCTINGNVLTIDEPFDATGLSFDPSYERPRFSVGEGVNFALDVKITNIEPSGDGKVRLTGFAENTLVYSAADGETVPITPALPPKVSIAPAVTFESSIGGSLANPILFLEWESSNADVFIIQQLVDGVWVDYLRTTKTGIKVPVDPGVYSFRVAGENILVGQYQTLVIDATNGPDLVNTLPPNIPSLSFDGEKLSWLYPDIPSDFKGYDVRLNVGASTDWDSAESLHDGLLSISELILTDHIDQEKTLLVKAIDQNGFDSESPATLTLDMDTAYPFIPITDLALQEGAGSEFKSSDLDLGWGSENNDLSYFAYYEVVVKQSGQTLRTERTISPSYSYTLAKNAADYRRLNAEDGAYYDFTIELTPVSKYLSNGGVVHKGPTVSISPIATPPPIENVVLTYSGPNAVLTVEDVANSDKARTLLLSYQGSIVQETKGNNFVIPVDWLGSRTFTVESSFIPGYRSSPVAVQINPTAPGIPTIGSKVISNTVTFNYSADKGSLPIERYEIRKSDTYSSAISPDIKAGNSSFTIFDEVQAGTIIYWFEAVDTAGNHGPPVSASVVVSQPQNYQLVASYSEKDAGWPGSRTNILLDETNALVLPVKTTDTWAQHFTSNGFNSPQEQIDANYEYFLQPSTNTAQYIVTYDYGVVLSQSIITANVAPVVLDGSVVASVHIEYSEDNTVWNSGGAGQPQIQGTSFRYVRVTIDFNAQDGDDLARVQDIIITLDKKLDEDSGKFTANAGDATGTRVYFNRDFIDAQTPSVNISSSEIIDLVVDFADTPDPEYFDVYVFRRSDGQRITANGSWAAKGFVRAGS